jgi:nitrogen fixation/metabolism regulation signal transduction histidine kinase
MSRVAHRIVVALLLAALLPLGAALLLALGLTEISLGVGLNASVQRGLANDLPLYRSLFDAKKAQYQAAADALARDPALATALAEGAAQAWVEAQLRATEDLASLTLQRAGTTWQARLPPEPDGRPLPLLREVPTAPGATLALEFRLPGRYLRELEEARALAETYGTLTSAREGITRSLLLSFATVLGVVLVGAVLAGLALARGVTRRVARLAAATTAVADGDFSTRVEQGGRDEIAELGRAFNTMVGELQERRDRIVYLEKISGWQEVARRLAHEIKNPLTPIVLAVQQLDEKKPAGDPAYAALVHTAREVIEEEVAALRRLVEEFSAFAKLPQVQAEPVDVAAYLREQIEPLRAIAPGAELQLEIGDALGWVELDRMLFRRVLSNLVLNAAQAQAGRPGSVRILLRAARHEGEVDLAVEDAGPGVDVELVERVFEPYVTTKPQGTGLGLAIVKKIVLQHRGHIGVERSQVLGGARLAIRLPGCATPPAADPPPPPRGER